METLFQGRLSSTRECSGFSVRSSFSHGYLDVRLGRSLERTTDLTNDFWSTPLFEEPEFHYMHLHRYPFELKDVGPRQCWPHQIRTPGIHGRVFVFQSLLSHRWPPRPLKTYSAHVPMFPYCDNDEGQLLLGKSLKDQLGEKMNVGECKCECHDEGSGKLERDFKRGG